MSRLSNVEFRELNGDAPLFTGKANYWVIVVRDVALRDDLDNQALADAAVRKWWGDNMSPIAAPELRALGAFKADGVPKGKRYAIVQPQPMKWDPALGYVFVALTWDHEGPESAVEWPWDTGAIDWANDWEKPYSGLIAVYQPGSIVEIPSTIDGAIWALGATADQVSDDAADAAGDVADAAKGLLVPLAVAAVAGVGLLLWSRR